MDGIRTLVVIIINKNKTKNYSRRKPLCFSTVLSIRIFFSTLSNYVAEQDKVNVVDWICDLNGRAGEFFFFKFARFLIRQLCGSHVC